MKGVMPMTAAFRGRQILLPLLFILLTAALFSCREKEEEKQYVYFDFQYEGRVDAVEITEGMKLSPPRCYREDYYVAYWTQENGRPIDKEEWKNITPVAGTVYQAVWFERLKDTLMHLDPDGGTCPVSEVSVEIGSVAELPPAEKEGFWFAGWYHRWENNDGTLSSPIERVDGTVWEMQYREAYVTARYYPFPKDLTITMGVYEQDNNLENGPEPIEWLVIAREEGKCLLLSRYLLDGEYYGPKSDLVYRPNASEVIYRNSPPRYWCIRLEDYSFTDDERAKILPSELSDCGLKDKVFLLSREEVEEYLFDETLHFENALTEYLKSKTFTVGTPTWDPAVWHKDPDQEYTDAVERMFWTRTVQSYEDTDRLGDTYQRSEYIAVYHGVFSTNRAGKMVCANAPCPSYFVTGLRPAMWVDESVVKSAMES